ncbi:MAG TPA: ADOP family duplicated permease [Bryobacteraceae bacterium]|nr:ADOP family duplicated permease [Bryobacteraceae bacterium]
MRFVLRSLLRNPGFALLAVLSLAAGIGLTAALLSVAEAILLRPLPVARPGEIARIFSVSQGQPLGFVSYPDFEDFARARSVSGAIAQTQVLVAVGDPPRVSSRVLLGLAVTANYFDVLGVPAAIGRTFRPGESRDAVVVVAHSFWQSQFGADRTIIGRVIQMGGAAFQVIGVAPENFGLDRFSHEQFYVPMGAYQSGLLPSAGHPLEDRSRRFLTVYVRAQPGARAEIPAIASRLEREYPESNRGRRAIVLSEFEARMRGDRTMPALTGLLAAVAALIALIACANLAGLLMLRNEARSREIAIKIAVGATRLRLFRERLMESALLAAVGASLGAAIAWTAAQLLASFATLPTDMPFSIAPRIDARVVMLLALATAAIGACAPSIKPRNSSRWRSAVVATEIAMATAMTVIGGMLLESIVAAGRIDLGYRTGHVLVMALDPAQVRYPEIKTRALYDQLLQRIPQLPGVRAAALAQSIPLGYTGAQRQIEIEGEEAARDRDRLSCWMNLATSGYFELLRMPVIAGRAFDDRDTAQSPPVAIVNQALARLFPGPAIGRRMRINGRSVEVVGIVRTAKYFTVGESPKPYFYLPYSQNYASRMVLHVETIGSPSKAAPAVIAAIRSLDASQPVSEIRALDDYFSKGAMFTARLGVRVMSVVSLCALLLAMAGLYGVVSQMVARRKREIGIRMALGARPGRVVALVAGHAAKLAAIGIATGFAAARLASRFVPGRMKPSVLLATAILILAATIVACLIPARRACSIDPSVALREQ